jgi:hypothetical protein
MPYHSFSSANILQSSLQKSQGFDTSELIPSQKGQEAVNPTYLKELANL